MNSPHDVNEARALATRYLVESSSEENLVFEEHLTDCAACRTEVEQLRSIQGELARQGARETPTEADALWEQLVARIDANSMQGIQPWKTWQPTESDFVPADAPWESSGIPGVESRCLHLDRDANRVTMLVRMAPGTSFPAHVHGGPETCFVVSGDLRIDDELHMHAGDFQRVEEGSRHGVQTTEGGCTLLISCSLSDQL